MLIRPPDRIKPTTPSIFQGKYYLSVQSLRRLVNVSLQYVGVFLFKSPCPPPRLPFPADAYGEAGSMR